MATVFRDLTWRGVKWRVMDTQGGRRAPGGNVFDSRNAVVLPNGSLELSIIKRDGVWTCVDMRQERGFGYGRYRWRVDSNVTMLDPNAVLGLFTYDWNGWSRDHEAAGELDIEFTRWGDPRSRRSLWYSVQPTAVRGGLGVTVPPRPPFDCWITWAPKQLDFVVRAADGTTRRWTRTGLLPPGPTPSTWPFMDLWLMKAKPPVADQRIVIRDFRFEPLTRAP